MAKGTSYPVNCYTYSEHQIAKDDENQEEHSDSLQGSKVNQSSVNSWFSNTLLSLNITTHLVAIQCDLMCSLIGLMTSLHLSVCCTVATHPHLVYAGRLSSCRLVHIAGS